VVHKPERNIHMRDITPSFQPKYLITQSVSRLLIWVEALTNSRMILLHSEGIVLSTRQGTTRQRRVQDTMRTRCAWRTHLHPHLSSSHQSQAKNLFSHNL